MAYASKERRVYMPRPCKRRRICSLPENYSFAPTDNKAVTDTLFMSIDEYEAVRLIDLEQLSQEECAKSMNVSRTTAQSIYNSARTKLAECLVKGKALKVEGGDYILCEESTGKCGFCRKKQSQNI